MNKLKKKPKQKQSEMTEDEIEENAHNLTKLMLDAVNQDNKSNSEKKPALAKTMLLDKVSGDLRKLPI